MYPASPLSLSPLSGHRVYPFHNGSGEAPALIKSELLNPMPTNPAAASVQRCLDSSRLPPSAPLGEPIEQRIAHWLLSDHASIIAQVARQCQARTYIAIDCTAVGTEMIANDLFTDILRLDLNVDLLQLLDSDMELGNLMVRHLPIGVSLHPDDRVQLNQFNKARSMVIDVLINFLQSNAFEAYHAEPRFCET